MRSEPFAQQTSLSSAPPFHEILTVVLAAAQEWPRYTLSRAVDNFNDFKGICHRSPTRVPANNSAADAQGARTARTASLNGRQRQLESLEINEFRKIYSKTIGHSAQSQ
jgi:hypothetical protein